MMHAKYLVQGLALLGVQEILILIISVSNNTGVEVTVCHNASTLSPVFPHPNALDQSMETPGP